MKSIDKRKTIYILCLIIIALLASVPAFRNGIYNGHDLRFHLGRIQAIAEELSNGQFPVRYESKAWHGYGYISTTFYGNIFLYIPALLYLGGVKLWRCYNVYILLVNFSTVFAGFYSFRRIFKSEKYGLMATGLYTLVGYRLSNLYVRAAVGEYTAMIFIPLVIYGMYRIYEDDEHFDILRRVIPLIIGATGLIQSHILTTEIVVGYVILYAIINLRKTITHIKELLIAFICSVTLNAMFIVPFIDAYKSMDLYINSHLTDKSIRGEGLYLKQLISPLTVGGGSSFPWSMVDEGHLNAGIMTMLCITATLIMIVAAFRKKVTIPKNIAVLAVFGCISIYMSTIYFPWDLFAGGSILDQLMSSLQYPWRYLLFINIFFIITGVYAVSQFINSTRWYGIIFGVVVIISLITTGYFYRTLSVYNTTIYNEAAEEDWADKLYLLDGTDKSELANPKWITEGNSITLPMLAYDNIHVYDQDNRELAWTIGQNNCIQVEYAGDYTGLHTKFKEPLTWRLSEIISLITVLMLAFVLTMKSQYRRK